MAYQAGIVHQTETYFKRLRSALSRMIRDGDEQVAAQARVPGFYYRIDAGVEAAADAITRRAIMEMSEQVAAAEAEAPAHRTVVRFVRSAGLVDDGLNGNVAVAELPAVAKPDRDSILRREPVAPCNGPEDVAEAVDAMQAELARDAERLLGYRVMRARLRLPDPLLAALAKLEIEPFDVSTVGQYKAEMVKYAQSEARKLDAAEGVDRYSVMARVASWIRYRLDQYPKPVPEYVLEKALQIKRECPAAGFQIEELDVVKDPFLIVTGPGEMRGNIVIPQRYHIEVWDEAEFLPKPRA